MSDPTPATVKRLYAVSGNQCAFPKCQVPLVEPQSGKVTGRICHIKGRKPGSARYDLNQTDAERRSFSNLVLMCPIHHDVIDDDPDSYTVERLLEIKAQHESQAVSQAATDEIAHQFIASAASNTLADGSIIFSQGQMGGQTAHSITNIGPQPREVSTATANALIAELLQYPGEQFDLTTLAGDLEAHQLAHQLENILNLAGWSTSGTAHAMFLSSLPRGVVLQTPKRTTQALILLNWLHRAGLQPTGEINETLERIEVIVGANT